MELLITIVIAGIAFAALVPVVVQALQTGQGDRARALAMSVAQDRLEKVRELGYEELTEANLNSSTFHAGLFGQTSNGPDGTTDREFQVRYTVTEVPVSATDTRIAYKKVTVSVDWTGAPYPHKTVSLSTAVYRQSAGPRIVDARLDPTDLNPDQTEIIHTPIRVSYFVDEADLPLMEPKTVGVAPNQLTIQGRVEITVTPGETFVVPYNAPSLIGPQPAGTVGRTGNEFYVYWSPAGGVDGAGDGYYAFSARAFSASGYVGQASDLIGSMKVETGAPAAVTNLQGTGFGTPGEQDGVANLLWTASTATDVERYVVYRSDDGGTTWAPIASQPVGPATGAQDTGLTTGETYVYRVVTIDWVDKESSGNPEIEVTILDAAGTPPEAPPMDLRADLSGTSVTLTWNESTSLGVVGYHAYASDGSAAPVLIDTVSAGSPMTTSYAQGAGKTLYYTVKAYRASSADSAPALVYAGYPTGVVGGEIWARVQTPTLVSYDISARFNSMPNKYSGVRNVELWYLGPAGTSVAVKVGATQLTTAGVPPITVSSADWTGQPAGKYQFRWLDVKNNGADSSSQDFDCAGAVGPNTPTQVSIR